MGTGTPARSPLRRRRIRLALGILAIAGAVLVVAAILEARAAAVDLGAGRAALQRALKHVQALELEQASEALAEADRAVRSADGRLGSLPVAIVARAPFLGNSVRVARALSAAGRDVVAASEHALAAAQFLSVETGSPPLRLSAGAVSLAPWPKASRHMVEAVARMEHAFRRVRESPGSLLVLEVRRARYRFLTEVADALDSARRVAAGTRLIPALLGINGERRYLVVVLNGAVARGAGGIVDALAVMSARGGRLALEGVDTEESLFGLGRADPDNRIMMNPDFPHAASELARLYTTLGGKRIDGVLAVDAHALGALLRITGPVEVPGNGVMLDADRIVSFLSRDIYARYPDASARAHHLRLISETVWRHLLAGEWSLPSLADEIVPLTQEKHLLVWSAHPTVQGEAEILRVTGSFRPPAEGDYLALIAQNVGGNKIDPYVSRRLRYEVQLSSGSAATVHASVQVRNDARLAALPPEAARSADGPGVLREQLSILGPNGLRWEESLRIPPGEAQARDTTFTGASPKPLSRSRYEYRLRAFRQPSYTPNWLTVVIVVPKGFRISRASDGLNVVSGRATWEGQLVHDMEFWVHVDRTST